MEQTVVELGIETKYLGLIFDAAAEIEGIEEIETLDMTQEIAGEQVTTVRVTCYFPHNIFYLGAIYENRKSTQILEDTKYFLNNSRN